MVRKPLRQLTLAEWRKVLDTNLTAAFLFAHAAEKPLRASRGAIVTIASTRALMSEPSTNSYSASTGGLVALTHALAVSRRVGRPEDIAEMAAFLLDRDRAGFVTGANFVVDGGMTRKMIYQE